MSQLRSAILLAAITALALALAVAFIRVIRGPTTADRLVGIDMSSNIGAGIMGVAGIVYDEDVFLDIAIIVIVTGFVGTATFAQLIGERRAS